jgi:DNA polymerase III epsilon subunit family exonuclease
MESGVVGFIAFAVLMLSILWFIYKLGKGILRGLFGSKHHDTSADNLQRRLDHLPEQFIVFDLETTGLDAGKDEIIEFGAIRVNRDSDHHEALQTLVRPSKKIPKKITELTGITQAMVESEGKPLTEAFQEFVAFIGDLPLVSFNAEFDIAFLNNAAKQHSTEINNTVSCALKMARRAWPGRKSYRLADLAKDGNLSTKDSHRALGDCQRALIVYTAAASLLGTTR